MWGSCHIGRQTDTLVQTFLGSLESKYAFPDKIISSLKEGGEKGKSDGTSYEKSDQLASRQSSHCTVTSLHSSELATATLSILNDSHLESCPGLSAEVTTDSHHQLDSPTTPSGTLLENFLSVPHWISRVHVRETKRTPNSSCVHASTCEAPSRAGREASADPEQRRHKRNCCQIFKGMQVMKTKLILNCPIAKTLTNERKRHIFIYYDDLPKRAQLALT